MKYHAVSFPLAIAALQLLGGCGRRETQVESGNRTQTLHLGNLEEPADLDPQVISSHEDHTLVMALFEGLTEYNPIDSTPLPGVAESWEHSVDSRVFTFHLRRTARWSDGDPVCAGDFVYAHQRILTAKLGAEYATLLYVLSNAERYHKGEITDFTQVGVRAVDDYTLEYSLHDPVPFFAGMVCHSAFYPLHKATLERFGASGERGTRWTRPGNLVGNGPFTLVEWKPQQRIRMAKSTTYWDQAAVRLNEVYFYPIQSEATEEAAFRTGQLHVTITLPIDKIAVYRDSKSPYYHPFTNLETYYYRLNVTKAPLDDVRVRRALSLSLDRRQIVEHVSRGGQPPAYHLTPPNTAGFSSPDFFRYDPAAAQKLLAEAGYAGGKGLPKIEILYNTNAGHRQIAEAIQQMWQKTLGIETSLYNQEAKTWSDTMRQMNYQVARFGWVGDYLDATTFLDLMTTGNGNNLTGFSNPEYDRLITKAHQSSNQAERFACFTRCEEILSEEAPIIPIYFYIRNRLRRPEVKGWYENLLDFHPLKGVYLQP